MKNTLLSLVLILAFGASAYAQSSAKQQQPESFIPKTLSAGTSMSARTAATTYDDTTTAFQTRSFSSVYVGIETAANDSVRILLSYAPSKDGVNFSSYVLFDSLTSTGTTGKVKYFVLPADAQGAHSIRLRVYGDSDVNRYSANPSTTVTTKIIRRHF